MGQTKGTASALTWEEIQKLKTQLRSSGIQQLLELWRESKDRLDPHLWGDEIEGILVSFDDQLGHVEPCFDAARLAKELAEHPIPSCAFSLESGASQLETIAGKPWTMSYTGMGEVEGNMRLRRNLTQRFMPPDRSFLTTTICPPLSPAQIQPVECRTPVSLIKQMISPTSRYQAALRNMRSRRGRDLEIVVPVYKDENTPSPFRLPAEPPKECGNTEDSGREGNDLSIKLDPSMAAQYACSLQVTMQASNITEARDLHDQLLPLSPIMLALSAATSIWNGVLADTDVRWNGASAVVDDRTPEEFGDKPSLDGRRRILRPRFSASDAYISQNPRLSDEYQVPNLPIDRGVKQQLLNGGMDDRLATHFAHLFIRDPLIVFAQDVEPDAKNKTALFEAVQGTNWNTIRFKPPPSLDSKNTGWRVEFRPLEVQLTDYENAAFAIFIVLLSRTILHFDLNIYMPIPMVDANMEKAHVRDAVNTERFYFRNNLFSGSTVSTPATDNHATFPAHMQDPNLSDLAVNQPSLGASTEDGSSIGSADTTATSITSSSSSNSSDGLDSPLEPRMSTATKRDISSKRPVLIHTAPVQRSAPPPTGEDFSLYSISTLMNGDPSTSFPGFIPLIKQYLASSSTPIPPQITSYLSLISARASGRAWTAAKWQREFVRGHPRYRGDSVVGREVMYDLLKAIKRMETAEGRREGGVGGMFGV